MALIDEVGQLSGKNKKQKTKKTNNFSIMEGNVWQG